MTSATHDFALQGMQADYDLAVYDADDQLVAATTERGTQSKQLRLDLEAGRYYALVTGHDGAYDPDSDYLLRVTRLGRGHSR